MKAGSLFHDGNDKAVVLFHSFTNNPKIFWMLFNELKKLGYTVYAPIFSGHDQEDLDVLLTYSADDWVADGQEALAFLAEKGYRKIAAFGLSLGGLIAIKMLLENDNVIAAGTLSSPVIPSPHGSHVAEAFLKTYDTRKTLAGCSAAEIGQLKANLTPKLAEVLESITNLAITLGSSYGAITTPVFIGHGGEDEVVDPTIAAKFRDRLINADKIDYHFYPKADHYLTIGKPGKALTKDLTAFLEQLDWA